VRRVKCSEATVRRVKCSEATVGRVKCSEATVGRVKCSEATVGNFGGRFIGSKIGSRFIRESGIRVV